MKGTVARVVTDRAFGFIRGEDDKDYFFHAEACLSDFARYQPGSKVSFEDTRTQKGLRAEHVALED